MPGKLDDTDRRYLQRAIDISRRALEDGGKTPFGALVVVSGTITAVLTVAFGVSGWAWFFGGVPAVLLYLYSFGLLHYRLLEKARDAVA